MKYLIAITLVFILVGCNSQKIPEKKVTIFPYEYNFKYTDPKENIPEELEMKSWDYTKKATDNLACKSGNQAKKYPLFSMPLAPCPNNATDGCGGTFERTAYKCDNENEYVIKEFHPAVGPIFYGPFFLR